MPEFIENKTCLMCGGPIPWRSGRKARDRAKFCGNEHKFQWQRIPENGPNYQGTKRTATCKAPDCGKEFTYYPSVRPNAEACSDEHRHVLHALKMTGRRTSNGLYTSVSTFRWTARKALYDRCSLCGWDEAPCDVAHIDPDGGTHELANVTMLCPNHHRMYDRKLIPMEEVLAARQNVLRPDAPEEIATVLPPLPGGEFLI